MITSVNNGDRKVGRTVCSLFLLLKLDERLAFVVLVLQLSLDTEFVKDTEMFVVRSEVKSPLVTVSVVVRNWITKNLGPVNVPSYVIKISYCISPNMFSKLKWWLAFTLFNPRY